MSAIKSRVEGLNYFVRESHKPPRVSEWGLYMGRRGFGASTNQLDSQKQGFKDSDIHYKKDLLMVS